MRRQALITLLVVLALLGLRPAALDAEIPGDTTLESPSPPASLTSYGPAISGDGRWIAFVETRAWAPPSETPSSVRAHALGGSIDGVPNATVVVLRDRLTGQITEVAPTITTNRPSSELPAISRDGCHVAFVTNQPYDPADTNTAADVYRYTQPACGGPAWTLVSQRDGRSIVGVQTGADDPALPVGEQLDIPTTDRLAISKDGRFVTFPVERPLGVYAAHQELVTADLSEPPGSPQRLALSSAALGRDTAIPGTFGQSGQPSISDDGRYVAFSTTLDPRRDRRRAFASSQVFVQDRTATGTAAFHLVSVPDDDSGTRSDEVDGSHDQPSISADGRFVAFASASSALVSGTTTPHCSEGNCAQIYLHDRDADGNGVLDEQGSGNSTVMLSRNGGFAGDGNSDEPSISGDAAVVAFRTAADNLAPDPTASLLLPPPGGNTDVLVVQPASGTFGRVSVKDADDLTPVRARSSQPASSTTGRFVAFSTGGADQIFDDVSLTQGHIATRHRPPVVAATPVDFGDVAAGTISPIVTSTLSNTGLTPFAPATFSTDAATFAVVPGGTCAPGAPIPPGGSCTVAVRFAAGTVHDGQLVVSEAGFDAITVTAPLHGNTVTNPTTPVGPTPLPGVPSAPALPFAPTLQFSPAVTATSRVTTLIGTGFPPSWPITLTWDGQPGSIVALTDASGGFRTPVLVRPHEAVGPRSVRAADIPGITSNVSAPLLVILPTFHPRGSSDPALRFGALLSRD